VRDFALRESTVFTESINKAPTTKIKGMTYDAEIRAYSLLAPVITGTWPPPLAPVAAAVNLNGNIGVQ